MSRGYARNKREEQKLIALGLKPGQIYLEGRGLETFGRIRMRRGEALVTINGLRALGDGRRAIAAAVASVHKAGAVVVDAETKQRSDKDGVAMFDAALARIHGERTMPDPKVAAAMQIKSARSRTKGRLPQRQAAIIWRDPRYTTGEAIARMPGWSAGTAYRVLGPRGLPSGRRGTEN